MRLSLLDQDNHPLILWLTRALADKVVGALVEGLDKTLGLPEAAPEAVKPQAQLWEQASADLQMKRTRPVVAPPEISEEGLVESIQIQRNSLGFILTFNWNAGSIALPTQTTALRQLLRIVHRNYQRARWTTAGIWPEWFADDAHKTLIGDNQIN